jgi:putative membrane protein
MIKPSSTDIDFIYLLFCGMISITAMLLPGISGAYILVLLGAYETMLLTFKEVIKFNSDYFLNFFSFAFGAILGVKLFSKFLTWSYTKYKNNTLYCLIGFMIGSLPSLWPWKYKNVSTSNFIQNMYIPQNYFQNSEFNQGILFFVIGVMVVLILERFSHERKK